MNTLYETILNFLNTFFPTAIASTWGNLNELIAYLLTFGIIFKFIISPILNLLNFLPFTGKKVGK